MSTTANPMRELVAELSPGALRALLTAAAERLATAPRPEIISNEVAVELHARAKRPLAIPQWTTADGKARGVVIQYWDYRTRRQAEERATIRSGPNQGQVDDWRRTIEEVAAGIVEPAGLSFTTIERWNHDVITFIHDAIEALGELPAAIIASELAQLAGSPPPPAPGDSDRGVELGDPADVGGEPGA